MHQPDPYVNDYVFQSEIRLLLFERQFDTRLFLNDMRSTESNIWFVFLLRWMFPLLCIFVCVSKLAL